MADQDDLLLLHHFRAHLSGDQARRARSCEALADDPGRAAGRVLGWALGRSASVITQGGRRALKPADSMVPSAEEKHFLRMVRALADRDDETARSAALWLVPKGWTGSLLDRAMPLASFYTGSPAAASRERCAARA
jgi:hypothetical protein